MAAAAADIQDMQVLRDLVTDMESELKDKSSENASYEAEIRSLQRKLAKRDAEIVRQERELHKLRVSPGAKKVPTVFTITRLTSSIPGPRKY